MATNPNRIPETRRAVLGLLLLATAVLTMSALALSEPWSSIARWAALLVGVAAVAVLIRARRQRSVSGSAQSSAWEWFRGRMAQNPLGILIGVGIPLVAAGYGAVTGRWFMVGWMACVAIGGPLLWATILALLDGKRGRAELILGAAAVVTIALMFGLIFLDPGP